MTVLLVLTMLALALTIDYVLNHRKERETVRVVAPAVSRPIPLASVVGGFRLMDGFRYHPGHTWAVAETPELVRVGIDDFASRVSEPVSRLSVPSRGQWIRQGQRVIGLTADGREYAMVSPVEGEVVDVNEAALADPAPALKDPYGEGWLLKVNAPDFRTSSRNLLSGTVARRWLEEAADRFRAMLPAPVAVTALDGGLIVDDVSSHLPEEARKSLGREFFLQ